MEKIWGHAELFYTFWAPWLHQLRPESKVFVKPRLRRIEIALRALHLAYPSVRDRLLALCLQLQEPYLSHLRNLRMAFEFLIPLVR
jgi:hypothetical protein